MLTGRHNESVLCPRPSLVEAADGSWWRIEWSALREARRAKTHYPNSQLSTLPKPSPNGPLPRLFLLMYSWALIVMRKMPPATTDWLMRPLHTDGLPLEGRETLESGERAHL